MGDAVDAVAARPARAAVRVTRIRVAVGTRLTVDHLAVAAAAARKVVAFNAAGEAVALRDADDVDMIARREDVDADRAAHFGGAVDRAAELADVLLLGDAEDFEAAGLGLRQAVLARVGKCQGHGFVAVGFDRFALQDHTGSRLDDGDGDELAVGRKHTRHPDLSADDVLHTNST